jgi:hypothetical protein
MELMMLVALAGYFLPTLLAVIRLHRSVWAIVAVNVLLGWTVIGWLWALIWSLTGNVRDT